MTGGVCLIGFGTVLTGLARTVQNQIAMRWGNRVKEKEKRRRWRRNARRWRENQLSMRNRWWLCAYPLFGVLEKDCSHLQVSVTGNPTYWLDVTSGSKSRKKPIFVSKQPPDPTRFSSSSNSFAQPRQQLTNDVVAQKGISDEKLQNAIVTYIYRSSKLINYAINLLYLKK